MNHDPAKTARPDAIPKAALWAAAALIVLTIGYAAAHRHRLTLLPAAADGFDLTRPTVVELGFRDRDDGSVVVLDGATDQAVLTLPPGTNGFVRGVMRGLARERRAHGLDHTVPFRLARWPDGHLTLEDPATGRLIELASFGATNQAAFGELWAAARRTDGARRTTSLGGGDSHAEFRSAANH